jgi:hypothetical protein
VSRRLRPLGLGASACHSVHRLADMAHDVEDVEDDLPASPGTWASVATAPGPAPCDVRRRVCRECANISGTGNCPDATTSAPRYNGRRDVSSRYAGTPTMRPPGVLGPHFHALSVDVRVHAGQRPLVLMKHGVLHDGLLVR